MVMFKTFKENKKYWKSFIKDKNNQDVRVWVQDLQAGMAKFCYKISLLNLCKPYIPLLFT